MASRSRRPLSLYAKTLLSLLLAVALVAVTAWLLGTRALERKAAELLGESLLTQARLMEPDVFALRAQGGDAPAMQTTAAALGERSRSRVTIIDRDGRVLGDSEETPATIHLMENHGNRPEVREALAGRVGRSLRFSNTTKQPMLYVAVPMEAEGSRLGALRVAIPATAVLEVRREIHRTVTASLVAGLFAALLLGAWLVGRVTRPLSRLTQVAQAYARGEFSQRAPDAPIREVRELADALDAMANAIREHIDDLVGERNQATAILQSMEEGVVALRQDGRIVLANPAAEQLLGIPAGVPFGQSFFEMVRHGGIQEFVQGALPGAQRATQEFTTFHPRERVLRLHGVPCEPSGPGGPSLVLVIQDVTERHRYEELRKEFVANVSHELKSPLTAIRSLTETLLGGALNDAANNQRFVHLIEEDAGRLSLLIDDLLTLSQIESQAVPLRRARVELAPLIDGVAASLRPAMERQGLRLAVDIPRGLAVHADPDRLKQVFVNLLDNAIKYNRPGGRVEVVAGADGPSIAIRVSDTGIGIPEADLPRIFERFYRVDKARSRELGGTGLGLSIVKHIIEAHGGRVEATSKPNEGSTFTLRLPSA